MTDAQKRAYDGIVSGPRGGARGPFNVLLRSPELADTVQRVGAHLRFNSSLPARLNELAIIINARHWGSKDEWYAHRPLAIKGGLAVIEQDGDAYIWRSFAYENGYEPASLVEGIGPFRFERRQYDAAVSNAANAL